MTERQEQFIYLLRLGLWGKSLEQRTVRLDDKAWRDMWQMAMHQTVQGIVYDGMCLLPTDEQPSPMLLTMWGDNTKEIARENRKQQVQLVQLHYFFETEHHHRFCLVKGQTVARHYRQPHHRYCGDLDLWFGNEERMEQANRLIESTGIEVQRGIGDALYPWSGTTVEHHSRLIDLQNPMKKRSLMAWEQKVFDESHEEPLAEANLLLQMTHILKHFIKGGGLGFRHICDLAVSMRSLEYDEGKLQALCRKYGIYRWADMLTSLVHQMLEVPLEELPFPCKEDPQPLFDEMWASGNFGMADTRFGEHPEGRWGSKWHTAKKVWKKSKVFYRVAPGECIWNFLQMVCGNVMTMFRKN